MRVAITKIPGVDSVRVSLNDGYADIALAERNAVTVAEVRNAVRKNGFTPRETRVRVRGLLSRRDGTLTLQVPGSTQTFRIGGAEEIVGQLEKEAGSELTVDGLVPELDGATPLELDLQVLQIEFEEHGHR